MHQRDHEARTALEGWRLSILRLRYLRDNRHRIGEKRDEKWIEAVESSQPQERYHKNRDHIARLAGKQTAESSWDLSRGSFF